jgi:cyclopropane fatty-acyl-phospholipid synthase-like methyltransferase
MKPNDHFAHKSKSWDMNSKRVKNAKAISETILKRIDLDASMHVMDLGAGTGLLTYFIAPHVQAITAVDNSPSMLEQFSQKRELFDCETKIVQGDIHSLDLGERYDGIVSSMTLHHIEDLPTLFSKLFTLLKEGGFIAIADLDREDGTFHSEDTGVHHFGFDREALGKIVSDAGFERIGFDTASIIHKPHRDFPVFVMTAYKPAEKKD